MGRTASWLHVMHVYDGWMSSSLDIFPSPSLSSHSRFQESKSLALWLVEVLRGETPINRLVAVGLASYSAFLRLSFLIDKK